MMYKKCIICHINKESSYFYNNETYKDKKSSSCKECTKLAERTSYAKSVGKSLNQTKYRNEYFGKIVDGRKICSHCNIWKSTDSYTKHNHVKSKLNPTCKTCHLKTNKITNRMLKFEFILAYGGKCTCCGETGIEFLTVEHIKEYAKINGIKLIYESTTDQLIRKLKALRWPEGYTVLYYNCNMSTKHGTP